MVSSFKGVAKTSLFKGAQLQKKWRAYIAVNGKIFHLGCFQNEIDAAKAYNQAAIKYFGGFACLNSV